MSPTTITFTLTPDEKRRLRHWRKVFAPFKQVAMTPALAIILIGEILLLSASAFCFNRHINGAGLTMLAQAGIIPYLALIVAISIQITAIRTDRQVREIKWKIGDTGLTVTSYSSDVEWLWGGIEEISRTDGFIAVKVRAGRLLYLPERAIESASPSEFAEYIQGLMIASRNGVRHNPAGSEYTVTFPKTTNTLLRTAIRMSRGSANLAVQNAGLQGATIIIDFVLLSCFLFLVSNAPPSLRTFVPVPGIALFYAFGGPMIIWFAMKLTGDTPVWIPWAATHGLMTVSLLPSGVVVSWNEGSCRLAWDADMEITVRQEYLVIRGKANIPVAIPNNTFLTEGDRNVFIDAAEHYRRGETPRPASLAWPPPPQ